MFNSVGLGFDVVCVLVEPTPPVPVRVQPDCPPLIAAEGTPPLRTMGVVDPMLEEPPPHTCEPSVTINGSPLCSVPMPETYQPPMTRSTTLPVWKRWPLPNGRSYVKYELNTRRR